MSIKLSTDTLTYLGKFMDENEALKSTLENLKREREQLQAHLEKRIKELVEEHKARNMAEARCTELAKLHSAAIAQSVKFANELIAERAAHNKLKALCHERGFGTPLFYTPPKLPTPKWVVCFYRDGLELGTIIYTHTPLTSTLNMLQESLKASSWRLTYHHD